MTREDALTVRDQAVQLRDNLRLDVDKAMNRVEQIRLTQLTAEAERLVAALDLLLTSDG